MSQDSQRGPETTYYLSEKMTERLFMRAVELHGKHPDAVLERVLRQMASQVSLRFWGKTISSQEQIIPLNKVTRQAARLIERVLIEARGADPMDAKMHRLAEEIARDIWGDEAVKKEEAGIKERNNDQRGMPPRRSMKKKRSFRSDPWRDIESVTIQVIDEAGCEHLHNWRKENSDNLHSKMHFDDWYVCRHDGHSRLLSVPDDHSKVLDQLVEQFPHFSEVVERLRILLMIRSHGTGVLTLPPFLLDGPPGVGKTTFVRRLATLMKLPFEKISMASSSTGWALTGLTARFSTGRYGLVADYVLRHGVANPFILLDEVEKHARDERYNASGGLYDLLEPANAEVFTDEFLDVTFNASHVNFFATANEKDRLDPPLLDRMRVVEARAPTVEEAAVIFIHAFNEYLERESLSQKIRPLDIDNHRQAAYDLLMQLGADSLRKFTTIIEKLVVWTLGRVDNGASVPQSVSEDDLVRVIGEIDGSSRKRLRTIGFVQ